MKNWKIGKKLTVTFGLIISLMMVVVFVALFSLLSNGQKFTSFYDNGYQITNKVMEIRRSIQVSAKSIGYSIMATDEKDSVTYIDNAKAESVVMADGVEFLRNKFRGDQALVENFNNTMNSIKEYREKVYELALSNQNDKASALYFESVQPGYLKAQEYLAEIYDVATNNANNNYEKSSQIKNITVIILVVVSIFTILITVYLGIYITKSLTMPIKELETAAQEMSKGNLKQEITYKSEDELGSLSAGMKHTMSGLSRIVDDIDSLLGEMAKGNFKIKTEIEDLYIGDFNPILLSMRNINSKLSGTLTQIQEASNQVAIGSTQMADSAQSLAEGATEQAGAVQELTATIENVASMSEGSANDSKEAYEQIKVSAMKAESSKDDMNELIIAMEQISTTSKEIENIIAAIEDIASQTNLLSLNASIEAARAGEAGKGFSVVADQIGKLAADSAKSAIDTKQLISKTLKEIGVGNDITLKASEAFGSVIDEMKKFADVAKNSSEVSMSQYDNLKQIQLGIEQISNVVQSNSASAEETSATSEELSAQADTLNSLIGQFKLKQI